MCPEPPGFSFAILGAMLIQLIVGSCEVQDEIHEQADGRHDRGGAVRRWRGAGARTELGVGACRCRAREV